MKPLSILPAVLWSPCLVAAAVAAPAPRALLAQLAPPAVLAPAPDPAAGEPVATLAPVEYANERLRAMVEELEGSSPTVAAMLLEIRRAGYPLSFGTFVDHAAEMRAEYRSWDGGEGSSAGYMAPVVRATPGFTRGLHTVRILVGVNLDELDALFAGDGTPRPWTPIPWGEIRRLETLSVLAHEIVHAYGLATSGGDPRGGCHDPQPGEPPEDSCVMIGENMIRKEIGAPLDWDYGFSSLTSLAERYAAAEARRLELLDIASFRLRFPPERKRRPLRGLGALE